MSQFIPLTVKSVLSETSDAVCVCLDIPSELSQKFAFEAGQYLTIRHMADDEELRRCYSICSYAPNEPLTIAIKKIDGGRFSSWANNNLRAGDVLEVMPPQGVFFKKASKIGGKHYLGVAAGSGITPILAIVKKVLFEQQDANFVLLYGNRSWKQAMFAEQIMDLKDRFKERLQVINIFSREFNESQVMNGRIDDNKLIELFDQQILHNNFDHIFACGPEQMMIAVETVLPTFGIDKKNIHTERFNTTPIKQNRPQDLNRQEQKVRVTLDGRELLVAVLPSDESVLDAALRAGADLPYACKGGVCATCRCRVLQGQMDMAINYSLEEDEVAKGYVLSCQALPKTDDVHISFDE